MRAAPFIAALALLALAGCDDDKQGTSIQINATDADGGMIAGVDGNSGTVSIKTPILSGDLKLPKMTLKAEDFDLNGVHLYPGSTISTMNVDAHDGKGGGDDHGGTVRVGFESPADPATVRDWFRERLGHAGFTLSAAGNGLTGTTDEKKPFRLELAPAPGGHAKGSITIDG